MSSDSKNGENESKKFPEISSHSHRHGNITRKEKRFKDGGRSTSDVSNTCREDKNASSGNNSHTSRSSSRSHRRTSRDDKRKESKKSKRRGRHSSSSASSSHSSHPHSRHRYRKHTLSPTRRTRRSRSCSRSSYSSSYSDCSDGGRRRPRREYMPNSTIMIRALTFDITEKEISGDILSCAIPYKEIRLIRDHDTGASRGFAFVEFNDVTDAVRYMQLRKGRLRYDDGCEANLSYSAPKFGDRSVTPSADWFCTKCSAHNFKRRAVCYRCNASKLEDGIPEPSDEVNRIATTTLLLRNLDTLTTEDNVTLAMQTRTDLGSIPLKNVKISREAQTKMSRGVCFIETNTVSDAVRLYDCLTQIPLVVDSRTLCVSYCKPPAQTVALNSAAAAALAAAQWSSSSTTKDNFDDEIQRMAEYSASLYAKTTEEKASYLAYYVDYFRNHQQPSQGDSSSSTGKFEQQPNHELGNRCASPHLDRLQLDNSTGYYFDPVTLLYYDSSTQYFYDSTSLEYLYWDPIQREYVSVSTFSSGDSALVTGAEKKFKVREKEPKIQTSKTFLKDTWRQPVKFSDLKKEDVRKRKDEIPSLLSLPTSLQTFTEKSLSLDKNERLHKSTKSSFGIPISTCEDITPNQSPSEDSGEEERWMDVAKLACTLCKRQFPNKDALVKHTQLSSLHLKNLSTASGAKTVTNASKQTISTTSSAYRDRAKERRKHFGPKLPS